jgi:hypothetical protein
MPLANSYQRGATISFAACQMNRLNAESFDSAGYCLDAPMFIPTGGEIKGGFSYADRDDREEYRRQMLARDERLRQDALDDRMDAQAQAFGERL